jgi:hypothetical protein
MGKESAQIDMRFLWSKTRLQKLMPVIICLVCRVSLFAQTNQEIEGARQPLKRGVTMADVIGMTRVAPSPDSASWQEGGAVRSPDGKHFAIVLRKGELKNNTNLYSLFVIDKDSIFTESPRKPLISFSSSSNREGIKNLTWFRDNDTIFFLGEKTGELTELYSIRRSTGELRQLTNHATNVTSYSISSDPEKFAYAAEKVTLPLLSKDVLQHGFPLPSNISLAELVVGHVSEIESDQCDLFVRHEGSKKEQVLKVSGRLFFTDPSLFLSPDAKKLVVRTMARDIDPLWAEYDDPLLKSIVGKKLAQGSLTFVDRYELIDLKSNNSRVLIDAPLGYVHSDLMWSSDSLSVIVTGTHLPLNGSSEQGRKARIAKLFVAEVDAGSGAVTGISDRPLRLLGLREDGRTWQFEPRRELGATNPMPELLFYEKSSSGWKMVDGGTDVAEAFNPDVLVEEGPNRPPLVVGLDRKTKRRIVLFDLNPQFYRLSFGKVEEVSWKSPSGEEITAGLYLPPGYNPGKRYPLVIQTHGYRPHEFWIDGPYTTAFAAQPLASKGIAVLQLPELAAGTAQEGEANRKAIESAIIYLDKKGIIDRDRVGLIGFSRTCYHVKYVLTHSNFYFGAASVTEGVDAGYFQYLIGANESPLAAADAETLVGAAPFGEGLPTWLTNSPGFLLDKVQTPLTIQALAPASLLGEWEWFAGLSRLGKAVEFVYLPTATHILQKPWDRMVSQQGSVDWFVFWLEGKEDDDPEKAAMYVRWRKLRKMQLESLQRPLTSGK